MLKKTWLRWLLALSITLSAAVYQRLTGPTYPLRGEMVIDNYVFKYKLERSHGGSDDQKIQIQASAAVDSVVLNYKRYKVEEPWNARAMKYTGANYKGYLPHQPPAGKIEYFIKIYVNSGEYLLPGDTAIVTRFKGDVPASVLIPHILFMFIAMLLSNLAGLEALQNSDNLKKTAYLTTLLLFAGGMVLGPIVQNYAFGAYWTGIPFGFDLTDNKTLLAMAGWIAASAALFLSKKSARVWVLGAAIILLMVYSIPHSMMGSELNYETMQVTTGE